MPCTKRIEIVLSDEELGLLRALNFPGCEELLTRARATKHGQLLRGRVRDFEWLVGWVAGEANHSRRGSRRADLLNNIADEIESVLATVPRTF